MIDVVMLAQNRPRLTDQALKSLILNTSEPWRLTVVDDGSGVVAAALLRSWQQLEPDRIQVIRNDKPTGPGPARNQGIKASEARWGRGDWLYLCDNDCCFLQGWDLALLEAWPVADEFKFLVLGAYCHPYNQTNAVVQAHSQEIHEKYAIGLLSWMMRWETWDAHGPFEPAPVANFSEDWAFAHKVRLAGYRVGCVWPWVVINCGMTGASGQLSPGSELIFQQPHLREGTIIE